MTNIMENANESLPGQVVLPRYEDISIHGPRDAFIPAHSPPPAYDSVEVQHGGMRGDQSGRPRAPQNGPSAPFLDSASDIIVLTLDENDSTDSGGQGITSETSRLLGERRRSAQRPRGPSRRRRYGSVDNPNFEEFLLRYTSINKCINRLIVFNFCAASVLLPVGVFNIVMPSSLSVYFGGVQLGCGLLYYACSLVLWYRPRDSDIEGTPAERKLASFGNFLTTLCAIISCGLLVVSAFSTAQEATYFLTCKDVAGPAKTTTKSTTPQLKCPDGTLNPPPTSDDILFRVIFQGAGCFCSVILSITFSLQMCRMDRFMVYRRVLNNI